MEDLWNSLHHTYNAANDREVDLSVLDQLPDKEERAWTQFTRTEVRDTLMGCSNTSAPGPDHITWAHLKVILKDKECEGLVVRMANACLQTGHWPGAFKESVSVIIPKPGKPSYRTPKAYRPIVLLNTMGKLIEKMLSK